MKNYYSILTREFMHLHVFTEYQNIAKSDTNLNYTHIN